MLVWIAELKSTTQGLSHTDTVAASSLLKVKNKIKETGLKGTWKLHRREIGKINTEKLIQLIEGTIPEVSRDMEQNFVFGEDSSDEILVVGMDTNTSDQEEFVQE